MLLAAVAVSAVLSPFAHGTMLCRSDCQKPTCCRTPVGTTHPCCPQAPVVEASPCECCIAVDGIPADCGVSRQLVGRVPQAGEGVLTEVMSAPPCAFEARPDHRLASLRSTVLLI
jgi:hypothetical protein